MKRLILFIVIAAFIGMGMVILGSQQAEAPATQENLAHLDSSEQIETPQPSDQDIKTIIPQIIGSQFNATTAQYSLVDLDGQNGHELIIGAIEDVQDPFSRPIQATIHVVSLHGATQQYDRLGSISYKEWMRGVPEVKELRDVTGDGRQEIIASLMYGGASNSAEGVLQVNFVAKKLNWLQLKNQAGQNIDAIFQIGGSSGHWNGIEFTNVDTDSLEELVEIYAQVVPFEDQNVQCEISVSKWDGAQFVYSAVLSAQAHSQLNNNCQL